MILIIFMIFSCTITMINLFIAVVIADKNELEETVFRENLFYMARSSEVAKDIFKSLKRKLNWTFTSFNAKFNVEQTKEKFCIHQVCGRKCWKDKEGKRKLPSYVWGTLPRLKEIAKQNITRENLKENQEMIDSEKAGNSPLKEQNLEKLRNQRLLLRSQLSSIDSDWSRPSSVVDRKRGFTDEQ